MPTTPLTEAVVLDLLRDIVDPEVGMDLVELGLIYDVRIEGGYVRVQMTLTTPGCPMHASLVAGVRTALLNHPEIEDVDVDLVWDPPWHPGMVQSR